MRRWKHLLPCSTHRWLTVGISRLTREQRCQDCGALRTQRWGG